MASSPERTLLSSMEGLLADSLLPGDPEFEGTALADAARFVLDAACDREASAPCVRVESETGPVGERQTRIAVINDDMPFLVDSIAAVVTSLGLAIDRLVHPVAAVERGKTGRLQALGFPGEMSGPRESMVYIETARADARTRVKLRAMIESALADVRAAVADWRDMQARMTADADQIAADRDKANEDAALLRWLGGNMLTQLGHVTRTRAGR